jgi:hypothetical protein
LSSNDILAAEDDDIFLQSLSPDFSEKSGTKAKEVKTVKHNNPKYNDGKKTTKAKT